MYEDMYVYMYVDRESHEDMFLLYIRDDFNLRFFTVYSFFLDVFTFIPY